MHHEARPEHATVAEHEREQPDHVLGLRLVVEGGAEMREVDLRLTPGRRLEADLEADGLAGAEVAHDVLHRGIAAGVAKLADLAQQADRGQLGKRREPLPQIALEPRDLGLARRPWSVGRRFQATLEVSTDGLAVEAGASGDGGNAQPLSVQIQDHHQLPECDHHRSPSTRRGDGGLSRTLLRRPAAQTRAGTSNWGVFKRRFWGECRRR
jgi:hypothetical protein